MREAHPSYRARRSRGAAMNVNIQIARILPTEKSFRANYFLFKPSPLNCAMICVYSAQADNRQYSKALAVGSVCQVTARGRFSGVHHNFAY
jgi:hypothetical protein